MAELSTRAKQLIPKARIMGFGEWQGVSAEAITILQAADDQKTYLSDAELQAVTAATAQSTNAAQFDMAQSNPTLEAAEINPAAIVKRLRDQAADIVDEARAGVLQQFPGILEPGGGLYPPLRADACWRDFWHFLRCITYGVAAQQPGYTSPDGLVAMEQLYEEIQVPLPAMVAGLKGLKKASLSRLPEPQQSAIAPYFDRLIDRLSNFL
ncbi:MAG: phycobilisome protein [Phormidesmis sp.]